MNDARPIADLGIEEVEAGLASGSIILVDVREPHETAHGMIPGSQAMPLSQFDPGSLPVEPGKRLVFACAAGVRSRLAIEATRRAGIAAEAHLGDGVKGWVAAGRPIV